jgi:hypothetical protein
MPGSVAVLPALDMVALKVVACLPPPTGSVDPGGYSGVEHCPDVHIHNCVHIYMIAADVRSPQTGRP